MYNKYKVLLANEAAEMITHGSTVGFSGFTSAGAAKAVPRAIAEKASRLHKAGKEYNIRGLSGASTGKSIDSTLSSSNALSCRLGYQSSKELRNSINAETVEFADIHLSHLPLLIERGSLGKIDFAVIEATEVTTDGRVYLTASVGISPTLLNCADKVIIEINRYHSPRLSEMTDIYKIAAPPRSCIPPISHPMDKIGTPFASVSPSKIAGIVYNDQCDETGSFTEPDEISLKISNNVVKFLVSEIKEGRIPNSFLPVQTGVGNIGNAVIKGIGDHPDIPSFYMYTEVFQDSIVELIKEEKVLGASTCALTISPDKMQEIYSNMDFFINKIVLRPQEISNNPILARKLGLIAINTALEADIYGNVNSTHVCGTKLMNGIGGSGDFERNSAYSIFVCPSIAKAGKISAIVPMCTHVDSSEHSVQVLVTEQGTADLRGLSPNQRAMKIIKNCVHPIYRDYLLSYFNNSPKGHIRHDLSKCFELHQNLMNKGSMLPDSM